MATSFSSNGQDQGTTFRHHAKRKFGAKILNTFFRPIKCAAENVFLNSFLEPLLRPGLVQRSRGCHPLIYDTPSKSMIPTNLRYPQNL